VTKYNRLHNNQGNEIKLAGILTIRDNFLASSIVKGQLPYRGLGSDVWWALEKWLEIVTREQKSYWLIKKAQRKPAMGLNLAGDSSEISLGKPEKICENYWKRLLLLERMIESELLADVVQRFRRSVNTQGKLARITAEDCKLFDDMMTKYSRYEHSQPKEAPVAPPAPDELKADLEKLQYWHSEFVNRTTR